MAMKYACFAVAKQLARQSGAGSPVELSIEAVVAPRYLVSVPVVSLHFPIPPFCYTTADAAAPQEDDFGPQSE